MLVVGDDAPLLQAQPVFGLPVDVPAQAASGPTVLLFLRHLGSPLTRATIEEVQDRLPAFERVGARVVFVAPGRIDRVRDFIPRYHVRVPVVLDDDGRFADAWSVGSDPRFMCTLKGLADRTVSLRRAARALSHGFGPIDGPISRLPGEFVVDRRGRIAYVRLGCSLLAGPDLDALQACAESC